MSGGRKRWISAEVDGRLVAQLEREAEARGISRSEAVRRALADWTKEAMEEDEERITRAQANHRQVMNRLDFIVGIIREQEKREARRRSQRDGAPRPAANPPRDGRAGEKPEAEPPDVTAAAPEFEGGALAEARKRARRRSG